MEKSKVNQNQLINACRKIIRHALRHRHPASSFERGLRTAYLVSAREIGYAITDARRGERTRQTHARALEPETGEELVEIGFEDMSPGVVALIHALAAHAGRTGDEVMKEMLHSYFDGRAVPAWLQSAINSLRKGLS